MSTSLIKTVNATIVNSRVYENRNVNLAKSSHAFLNEFHISLADAVELWKIKAKNLASKRGNILITVAFYELDGIVYIYGRCHFSKKEDIQKWEYHCMRLFSDCKSLEFPTFN